MRCAEFARDYRQVGKEFVNDSSIIVTKMNLIHNDPPFHVYEVPTIVLYYRGLGKQYVVYNGIMHSLPLIEWINKHKQIEKHDTVKKLQLKK